RRYLFCLTRCAKMMAQRSVTFGPVTSLPRAKEVGWPGYDDSVDIALDESHHCSSSSHGDATHTLACGGDGDGRTSRLACPAGDGALEQKKRGRMRPRILYLSATRPLSHRSCHRAYAFLFANM